VSRWAARFGHDTAEALCEASNSEAPTTLRVNTLVTTPEDLVRAIEKAGGHAEKRTQIPEELTYSGVKPPVRMKAFQDGHFMLQDAASMLPAHLLEPRPGQHILDMCAAPGGKATHIAQLTNDNACVVAMDLDPRRLGRVHDNVRRLGLCAVSLVGGDGTRPPAGRCFDRVLVDAPCSGLGTLRRHPDLKWRLKPEDDGRFQQRQLALLRSAVRVCKNGGLVVYAVCSFALHETEYVAQAINKDGRTKFEDGPQWLSQWKTAEGRYTILPQKDGLDGYFLMRLRTVS